MTYRECLDYIYAQLPMYQRVGSIAYKKDLGNIKQLCAAIGNPQDHLKCIHVGGTNGKGTVSHLLAYALQLQGYKTGLYTSPHYVDFRERIKINGQYISKRYVSTFIEKLKPAIEVIKPSFFEITVALAFDYFYQSGAEYCVIEVGLGGRLDSTNIIRPLLSVITNISLDHTDMLGDTLAAIASEKAGIIKSDIPVLIGERQTETHAVFAEAASKQGAPLYYADEMAEVYQKDKKSIEVKYADGATLNFQSVHTAPYQLKNYATAAASLLLLKNIIHVNPHHIFGEMNDFAEKVNYMGRWQVLGNEPLIIADSAHNEGGLKYVFQKVDEIKHRQLHIVMGMVNDKKTGLVFHLFPKDAVYYFAKANIPRGKDAQLLQAEAAQAGLSGKAYTSTARALAAAKMKAGKNDLILITGSIFTVAEVLPVRKIKHD